MVLSSSGATDKSENLLKAMALLLTEKMLRYTYLMGLP